MDKSSEQQVSSSESDNQQKKNIISESESGEDQSVSRQQDLFQYLDVISDASLEEYLPQNPSDQEIEHHFTEQQENRQLLKEINSYIHEGKILRKVLIQKQQNMKIGAKRLFSETSQQDSDSEDDELNQLQLATYQKYLKHSGNKSLLSCLGLGLNFLDQDPALLKIKKLFEEALTEQDNAQIQQELQVYQEISKDFSSEKAKIESKRERAEMGVLKQNNLTYGEVHYQSIAECFRFIRNKYGAFPEGSGGNFVDLGSGSGKGVLTAALMHNFDRCVGIEILQGLFNQSEQLKEVYEKNTGKSNFEVYNSDFLECDECPDWTDIDSQKQTLILANSTCFDQGLLKRISKKCSFLKKGDWVFTLTKKLVQLDGDLSDEGSEDSEEKEEELEEDNHDDEDSSICSTQLVKVSESEPQGPEWECIMSIKREMSWGLATVHLQTKIS